MHHVSANCETANLKRTAVRFESDGSLVSSPLQVPDLEMLTQQSPQFPLWVERRSMASVLERRLRLSSMRPNLQGQDGQEHHFLQGS